MPDENHHPHEPDESAATHQRCSGWLWAVGVLWLGYSVVALAWLDVVAGLFCRTR